MITDIKTMIDDAIHAAVRWGIDQLMYLWHLGPNDLSGAYFTTLCGISALAFAAIAVARVVPTNDGRRQAKPEQQHLPPISSQAIRHATESLLVQKAIRDMFRDDEKNIDAINA